MFTEFLWEILLRKQSTGKSKEEGRTLLKQILLNNL